MAAAEPVATAVTAGDRPTWTFFRAVHAATPTRSTLWWAMVAVRGALPAVLGVLAGWLTETITEGGSLTVPLVALAVTFVVSQMTGPIHEALSYDVGEHTATAFNDQLLALTTDPPGIAHLERDDLSADLSMAKDFDLGLTGPPLAISMTFIADGAALFAVGVASSILLTTQVWWGAAVLVPSWLATHWLLRESRVWEDRQTPEVQRAQRLADYGYRLAVDAPAAKEIRLFGLGPWIVERFGEQREHLYRLQYEATRLRERSTIGALAVVLAANGLVFWVLAERVADGRVGIGGTIIAATAALGVSGVAFGGLSWAIDGAAAPATAIERLRRVMPAAGALDAPPGPPTPDVAPHHGPQIRFRDVTFSYPRATSPVLTGFDLTIPAGTAVAIVGQNGAGKTTLAKLICRLYDPQSGTIEIDGTDLRRLDVDHWRRHVTAVFQDFVRFELSLRENVTTDLDGGRPGTDDDVRAALADAGADHLVDHLAGLDTPLAKAYPGGTDLSGGQWQRVALARALYAVRRGAGVVLLDEPTAQLDVRGETEIFERVLRATAGRTVILVSHRFSTVRRADVICVVEDGRVVEQGSHDELMARRGRYRTMFDLQAARFVEVDDHGEQVEVDVLD